MPTIVAAWDRIRRGLNPVDPRADLSQAANFLYMRSGKVPHAIEADALDTYFVLLADHSYNASTFAARVAASTRADHLRIGNRRPGDAAGRPPRRRRHRVVSGAFRSQSNPKTPSHTCAKRSAANQRIMGMGHREYKVRDPRARHLEAMAKKLSEHEGNEPLVSKSRTNSKRPAVRFFKRRSPTTRFTQTSTSTRRRC